MRVNQESELEFLNAAGAVYAWMCSADGKVTNSESEGFAKYLNRLPYVNDITHEDFIKAYAEILEAFKNNFKDGKNRALARIEPLRFDKSAAIELIKVARLAMIADEKLQDVEELILKELCELLGVQE